MPGLTAAKVASLRLNFGNRRHKLTRKHGAVFSSVAICQQDGDRCFERLQPAAKKLHVLVVAAAAVLLLG